MTLECEKTRLQIDFSGIMNKLFQMKFMTKVETLLIKGYSAEVGALSTK